MQFVVDCFNLFVRTLVECEIVILCVVVILSAKRKHFFFNIFFLNFQITSDHAFLLLSLLGGLFFYNHIQQVMTVIGFHSIANLLVNRSRLG